MNRFFDMDGDLSTQLAPWVLQEMRRPLKPPLFRLERVIRFISDIAGGVINVPAGYISDLASIPRFAWTLFLAPDDPRIELGSWLHDFVYTSFGKITLASGRSILVSRKDADKILCYEAMPDLMASPAQIFVVYQALRRFGTAWEGDSVLERLT